MSVNIDRRLGQRTSLCTIWLKFLECSYRQHVWKICTRYSQYTVTAECRRTEGLSPKRNHQNKFSTSLKLFTHTNLYFFLYFFTFCIEEFVNSWESNENVTVTMKRDKTVVPDALCICVIYYTLFLLKDSSNRCKATLHYANNEQFIFNTWPVVFLNTVMLSHSYLKYKATWFSD